MLFNATSVSNRQSSWESTDSITDSLPGSPLYSLPNVQLSSHIAGSLHDEVVRMADYVIAEYERWARGEPLRYAVTLEMLATMA